MCSSDLFPSDNRLYLYRRGTLKAVFFANTDWYLYNFRLDYAKFLRSKGWEVVFVSPTGGYESLLIDEGFRVIPFSLSRKGINPFIESDTIARIQSVLAREKPDLVQNYTVKCVIYGSIATKNPGIIGSSHPGAGAGPKGMAVRHLKRYASWVQNVVRQFGPYPPRA